jgi:L-fuconolactonase
VIVDAQQYLWTADHPRVADEAYRSIRRDFTVVDLRENLSGAGVDACVLVESGRRTYAETRDCLALAAETEEIIGVVGWAPLADPSLEEVLDRYRSERGGRLLVAIRHQLHEEDDAFLDQPAVQTGLRTVAASGLINELAVRPEQLGSVVRAADAVPEAQFVLDQLGSPWIAEGVEGLVEWLDAIKQVAACPNVVAKLSGLITLADWDRWCLDDLRPYVDHAVSLFGPKRLMFGSDWPVCELAATYDQTMNAIVSLLGGTPGDVFAGTAMSTYRLEST